MCRASFFLGWPDLFLCDTSRALARTSWGAGIPRSERKAPGKRGGENRGRFALAVANVWLRLARALGAAVHFLADGLGIRLAIGRCLDDRAVFCFFAREAAQAEESTDFGAGGVHFDSGLLGGEPAVVTCGHLRTFLPTWAGAASAAQRFIHSSGNY